MRRESLLLVKVLKERELTLALAESITCGLASHMLGSTPNTSQVFRGSIICYTPELKKELLGISAASIKRHTCESKEITAQLASNLGKRVKADVYAAVTGLASPGGSETKEKPVGTVFFSVVYNKKQVNERRLFRGSPLEIRTKACKALFKFIKSTLTG